jgi:hypothetical protein
MSSGSTISIIIHLLSDLHLETDHGEGPGYEIIRITVITPKGQGRHSGLCESKELCDILTSKFM